MLRTNCLLKISGMSLVLNRIVFLKVYSFYVQMVSFRDLEVSTARRETTDQRGIKEPQDLMVLLELKDPKDQRYVIQMLQKWTLKRGNHVTNPNGYVLLILAMLYDQKMILE